MGVEELLVDVRETAADRAIQDALRLALRDPSLRLAPWRAEQGGYVDVDGDPFTLAARSGSQAVTVIESEQHGKLAALVHDRGMLPDPELLTSVLAAARLALERNVLQTEVRARVAELERERDFIRDVVNAAPAFFAVADLDGQIVRFNDALVAASGIRDDERVRGRSFATVFVSDRDRAEVRRLIAARERGPHEHHWLGRDTTDLVVEWSSTPINDEHGNPRLLITGLDVSDRARHEEELRREHDFLSSVGRATPSLLCVVHADGTVDRRGVNRAFAAATGIDDADAVGRRFWDLVIPPEHHERVRRAFYAAVATGDENRLETPWRGADGGELIVEWWTSSLASYRPHHYLICGRDVTQPRRDEDEVRRSRTRLVEAGDLERRRLERDLHEGAQQHLLSASLTLRVAESSLDDADRARALLGEAREELSQALNELRELARGLHPALLADRGLGPALGALADRSAVPAVLRLDFEERLPEPIEACLFYAVSESLANVAQHARANRTRIHVGRQSGAVFASVLDDGVGGADPGRGSGLRGLADRIEAVGGKLELRSPPGEGTTVTAIIPCEPSTPGASKRP